MTSRADIQQKMRDAAANGASGKVEWCAGWLRGYSDAALAVAHALDSLNVAMDDIGYGNGDLLEAHATLDSLLKGMRAPQASPQSDPTALDAWQQSAAESRRRE